MDFAEKRVLKRKRHTIALNLELTEEYIEEFKNSNLLTNHTIELVLSEGTNFQRVIKLMELIPPLNDSRTIEKLSAILEREHEWLADELRAELAAERGQLKIDDYIIKESAALVYREFGHSRRLSEREKKDIQMLVALRTQYAKEVWRRRLDLCMDELKVLRETNAHKDAITDHMMKEVTEFIRVHKHRLRTPDDSKDTAVLEKIDQQGAKTEEYAPLIDQLEDALKVLKEITSKSLKERDNLYDERMRALAVLDLKDVNAKIDVELERIIQEALRKLAEREKEAQENARKTEALRAELEEMKRQSKQDLLSKEKTMEELAAHLNHSHQRVRNMQEELERLKNELVAVQKDCIRYRDRAERLERARRLGYLNEKAPGRINSSEVTKSKISAKLPSVLNTPRSRGLKSARSMEAK